MRTAVVILNWNTKDFLQRWLPGLTVSCNDADAEVVVADNSSTDGSLEMMAERFPSVRTIPLDKNYGFTGGYNRAIEQILEWPDAPEYVVLMNSDIEVAGGWLQPLVAHMDAHAECGICGPKLHALEKKPDGSYLKSSRFEYAGAAGGLLTRHGFPYCRGRFLSWTAEDRGQFDRMVPLKWVSGACFMTRSSLWRELGGLDERFFAHMEEIDFCWRARRAGYCVNCVPDSVVWHLGGGTLPQGSVFKLKLNFRNSLLMLAKNLPAELGPKRAGSRIRTRMAMDRVIALAYRISGRRDFAEAVKEAHIEFKQLEKI
ncbi:MAG: glycosyltransferase family 2 protein [Bacteroidales bacterium]|nr:glycosyltransferase family 2 protein [Bacteroidales bacterium]